MLQPSRAALPLLEHCVRVCRSCPGTSTGLLPQAQWNLALVQLETGAPEQALATARAGIGLCDGPQSAGWDGQFRSLVGRCLDRIGDPGAEAELRSGYLAVAESIGLLSFHTIRAHRWLQDHYRDHGRLSSSVELAHDRLTGLLRQSAPPEALHDAVWTIVRTPAGVGAAATSAVEAATKACFLEPDRFVYRMGLGAALLRAGDLLGSLEALREASRLCVETGTDDGATPVPALRAIVLARFGRKAEAEAELARAGSIPGSDLVAEAEAAVAGR